MVKDSNKRHYTPIKNERDVLEEGPISDSNTSSTFKSICNLINDIEGNGLLALPYILKIGGITALVALAIVPIICYYTGKILIECLYDEDNYGKKIRVRRNYRDLGEGVWTRYGGIMVASIPFLSFLFLGSAYVLCGSMLHGLLPDTPVPKRLWMVIAGVVGLPALFIKHLSHVAWFSLLGIISLMSAVFITLGYGASITTRVDIENIPIWDSKGSLIAVAVLTSGYAGHPVMPTIESNMRYPDRFNFVLAISYLLSFVLKLVFALGGFLAFYPNIDQVITNNISLRPLQIVTTSLLFLNVCLSYPFLVKSFIHCIEDSIANESIRSKFDNMSWFISIRIFVNLVIIVPAVTIPHFALMMFFVSSLFVMLEVFIFPCIFHLYFKTKELYWYQKCIDYLIIIFGIFVGIVGLVVSTLDIIKTL